MTHATPLTQNSRKRSTVIEPELIEIPPPVFRTPKRPRRKQKQKQIILHEIIDVDGDDNHDVIFVEDNASGKNKGKVIKNYTDTSGNDQIKKDANIFLCPPEVEVRKSVNGVGKSSIQGLDNEIILDGVSSNLLVDKLFDDGYNSFLSSNFADFNEYAILQTHFDCVNVPPGMEASDPWFSAYEKKKSASGTNLFNPLQGMEPSLASFSLKPAELNMKPTRVNSSSLLTPMDAPSHPSNVDFFAPALHPQISLRQAKLTASRQSTLNLPLEVEPETSLSLSLPCGKKSGGVARSHGGVEGNDILRKFEHFKRFDTVEDYSDHHYKSEGSSVKQPPKEWAKRIQEDWRILEKDLTDMIFVRVYETRMDLMRAVIIGAQGTPYHDGLFFFDVFFPSGYPKVPPHVYYHSGGLRLNPNLYQCGKVCLSLLNTWSGNKNEKWIPKKSTMLQVLFSIQALILNQKPFFNEPGYAHMSGSENGELKSQQYNEDTFILSLRTMTYIMRRPPKHFEDFVRGHFYKRAHDILVACEAYMDGAQVGCLVKGGVQDIEEGDKSCSQMFKESLPSYVNMLLGDFEKIGVKNLEKFQKLGAKERKKNSSSSKPVCLGP
ncbi:hypothetical protein HS088_TW21G00458 [Tripterygium wilfordii]|uniref:E2 ubiquitin-conjugating enzyme n=1 Tax=Tripterygium wilfordii TaxID=458696 RepID=A0A7J7C2I5_TRIWF|nr:probable ubiquitin-conjugating enzyme E2 26 [Tripterygium wilfordii]KAF5728311.1 hypothetical protein HS088_TW21G00458 [Tripterygium wilfordii]